LCPELKTAKCCGEVTLPLLRIEPQGGGIPEDKELRVT